MNQKLDCISINKYIYDVIKITISYKNNKSQCLWEYWGVQLIYNIENINNVKYLQSTKLAYLYDF